MSANPQPNVSLVGEPDATVRRPQRGAIIGTICATILPVAVVLLHLIGPDYGRVVLWGADFWAFLPLWACGISVAAVTLAAWPLIRWLIAATREPEPTLSRVVTGEGPRVTVRSSTRGRHPRV